MKANYINRLIVLMLLLAAKPSFSQNMVPNCSFESYSVCPTAPSQFSLVTSWKTPTRGTSDYYNTCTTSTFVGVPSSAFGFQNPRTGNGYGAFFVTTISGSNYYEYCQTQLSTPMVIGKTYYVEFYVSLADSVKRAATQIGAYFSTSAITTTVNTVLPVTPQVINTSGLITDKVNWTKISACYTATSATQYMTIGGFNHPAGSATFVTQGYVDAPYYYIDDVSVIPIDEYFSISATPSNTVCSSSTTTLTIGAPSNYTFCDGTLATNAFTWLPLGSLNSYTIANPVASSYTSNVTYTLQISNSLCGVLTNTITIFACASSCPSQITPNITSYNATCASPTGSVEITSVTNGSPSYTIMEGGSAVANNVTVPHTITNVSVGTHTYVISSSNSCSSIFTVTILPAAASPTVSATLSNTLSCITNSAVITATSTTSGVTYSWSPQGVSTNSALVNSAGNYTVVVTNTITGCSSNTVITVNQNTSAPTVSTTLSNTLSCANNSAVITATSSTSGVTYSWSPQGVITNTVLLTSAGNYTLTVTNTVTGCSSNTVITVNQNTNAPTISTTLSNILSCATNSAVITATSTTSGVTYSWSPQGVITNSIIVSSAGNYTLTVTNTLTGCSSNTVITVNQNTNAPTISVTLSNTLSCATNSAVITTTSTTSGVTYSWSPQGVTTHTVVVNSAGNYTVTVTDNQGCSSNTIITIPVVLTTPTLTVSSSQTLTLGNQTQLNISGATNYTWTPSVGLSCSFCDNPIATPSVTTNYCVFATSASCSTQSCVTITVEESCNTNNGFQTPNAFSPNGDGVNDEFCLQGWENCVADFNIIIFNRWGEKVFESLDENFCWDGLYKNKTLNAGVFVFVINAVLNNNEQLTKKGNITLIK